MTVVLLRHPAGAFLRVNPTDGECEYTFGDPSGRNAMWHPLRKAPDYIRFIDINPVDVSGIASQ